ncbi:MAG: hypothetical protein CL897_04535 [Dehalococcoidia bacterium]|mgnify:CR=1 FL=1|nr:hypothetical protein [Dehalococcoidia bacterium]HCV00929.1 hypothetical protein [Dehalococcoidia bacterium]|tara:strand:- start:1675 stop:2322 length:648 start_codon:yes stop_codon:yes gene_type:complete
MAESGYRRLIQRYGGYAVLGVSGLAVILVVLSIFVFIGNDDESGFEAVNLSNPVTLGVVGREIGVIDDHRPLMGRSVPDFALANARDPKRVVRLSDFLGTPVVLNWYASWCGPCRMEIPDFQKAYEALDGKVVFVGVNLNEDSNQAIGLLDVFVAKYPALLDSDGAIAFHYRITGMPTTFFIDADGILRSYVVGLIVEEVLVQELATIGIAYNPK